MQTESLRPYADYANVWVEITSLDHGHGGEGWELGHCLWSPAKNTAGNDRYNLMREPKRGDLVLHFVKARWPNGAHERRVAGWSLVAERCREVNHEPPLPGSWTGRSSYYRVELQSFQWFKQRVSTDEFAAKYKATLLTDATEEPKPPFSTFGDGVRLNAGLYLRRCSERVYKLLMHDLGAQLGPGQAAARVGIDELGLPYRSADEDATTANRDPFQVDPNKVDRGNRGHAMTQNALAAFVSNAGFQPRSPSPTEPDYDLAWVVGEDFFVAEVKSITQANEERQLRLGLGQVLRYRHMLTAPGRVQAVLAIERSPSDVRWHGLCASLDVHLVWPGIFDKLAAGS